jgi:hypothetical protein
LAEDQLPGLAGLPYLDVVVTFMTAVFGIGGFMLIASFAMFLMKFGSRRVYRKVAGTRPTALGSWRRGTAWVAATGVTDYGPAGPQVGPVSGEDCAWYRIEVVRTPSRKSDDRTGQDLRGEVTAPSWPTLTDSSGRVVIDPRVLVKTLAIGDSAATERAGTFAGARFGSGVPAYVPAKMVGKLRSYEDLHLTEVRLPIGREVYALGSVRGVLAGLPVLAPGRWGVTVFTTDDRDQVRTRRAENAAAAHTVMRAVGVLGLVMTAGSAGVLYLLAA